MQRRTVFTNKSLLEELSRKGDKNRELYIEDMVTGAYSRCFGVEFDDNGNIVLRVKSLENLYDGRIDLYTDI